MTRHLGNSIGRTEGAKNEERIPPTGFKLIAVEAQSNFCWSDDSWDPMDEEVVAIYRSESEFRSAESQNAIPIGTTYRAERRQFNLIEVPIVGDVNSDMFHIVFEAKYHGISHYSDREGRIHDTYRIDSTGIPITAHSDKVAAKQHKKQLDEELRVTKPRSIFPYEYGDSVWAGEGGQTELWELTSLEIDTFARELGRIGLDVESWCSIWYEQQQESAEEARERDEQARQIWQLLDRVVLHKVVSMPFESTWYHLG